MSTPNNHIEKFVQFFVDADTEEGKRTAAYLLENLPSLIMSIVEENLPPEEKCDEDPVVCGDMGCPAEPFNRYRTTFLQSLRTSLRV